MRKSLIFAAIATVLTASAQEAKVTYSTVAVSAKKAIADLAQKSGVKMACSTAMENEILILRLKDADLGQVMKQIAAVTSGTWAKEGDTLYLAVNGSARQTEENQARQRLSDKIAASLKKTLDDAAKKKTPDPAPDLFVLGANDNAVLRLASLIGANQLASVPDGGRLVFSSSPNSMQRALPAGSSAILDAFVAEHNKAAALAKNDEPAKEPSEEEAIFRQLMGNRLKKPERITAPPAKALLIAARRGMFMGYSLQLRLYDANGKVLASAMAPLVTDLPFDPQTILKPQAPPKTEGPEIVLSPLAKELYAAGQSMTPMGGAGNLKFSKELMASLRDPVAHDPLSYAQSEALIAVAEQRNEQLVADLPDGLLSFFGNFTPKGKLTANSFLKDIQGEQRAKVSETGGWLVVSPDDPVRSRRERVDRVALRNLIDVATRNGGVGLDDIAAYSLRNQSPLTGAPASTTYIMLFAPGAVNQGIMGMSDWELVRFYGMLGETQRQTLRQGGRILFGSLSPQQQSQVVKMVFGADGSLQAEAAGRPRTQDDPLTELITSQIERATGGDQSDYRTEPTEVMPNGLPQNGTVVVAFTSEPVAQPQTMSTDFGRGATLGPLELGLFKFFKEDPNMAQVAGQIPTIDDLKVGTRSIYNFSFYVAPNIAQKGTLHDDRIAKDAPTYKMSALPSDFQQKIDDMSTKMKKNPIWGMIAKMGGFGNRAIPPQ